MRPGCSKSLSHKQNKGQCTDLNKNDLYRVELVGVGWEELGGVALLEVSKSSNQSQPLSVSVSVYVMPLSLSLSHMFVN